MSLQNAKEYANIKAVTGGFYIMVDKDKCIGCGACEGVCPVGAIKVENGKSQIDDSICIKCGSCEGICPVEAIKIKK